MESAAQGFLSSVGDFIWAWVELLHLRQVIITCQMYHSLKIAFLYGSLYIGYIYPYISRQVAIFRRLLSFQSALPDWTLSPLSALVGEPALSFSV